MINPISFLFWTIDKRGFKYIYPILITQGNFELVFKKTNDFEQAFEKPTISFYPLSP
jgi:hypothetical protein